MTTPIAQGPIDVTVSQSTPLLPAMMDQRDEQ